MSTKVAEKFRQMSDPELQAQEQDMMDQLFRLRFQMAMGQTESVKKLRELRRNIARVKTVVSARRLSGGGKS
jgi:large subunit ribosomal protein L29